MSSQKQGCKSHPHSAAGAGVSALSRANKMDRKVDREELERGQSDVYAGSDGKTLHASDYADARISGIT